MDHHSPVDGRNPRRGSARHRAAALCLVLGMAVASAAPARPPGLGFQYGRPAGIPAHDDTAGTPLQVALGRRLFLDPRLSGSGTVSCGSCHLPSRDWQDGRPRSVGHRGEPLARRTPTLLDVAWVTPLTWDGHVETLEEQVVDVLGNDRVMGGSAEAAAARVAAEPTYAAAFGEAFPGQPISLAAVARAIAAFERTLASGPAPFDRWVTGDPEAIPLEARRGFALFTGKANCVSCHAGWRFTNDRFHDIGLPGDDPGRGAVIPELQLFQHAFKTPTLRNVARRAPYMHDGSIPTLEGVVEHYDRRVVTRPSIAMELERQPLTERERADIVAFLKTLSSDPPAADGED